MTVVKTVMGSILSVRTPECITCNPVTSDVWDWWCWASVKIKIFLWQVVPSIIYYVYENYSLHPPLFHTSTLFNVLVLLLLWCLSFLLELMGKCPSLLLPSPPWIESVPLVFTFFPASNAEKWKIGKPKAIIPHIPNFPLPPIASAPPDSSLVGQGEKQEGFWHCINNKTNIGVLSRLF